MGLYRALKCRKVDFSYNFRHIVLIFNHIFILFIANMASNKFFALITIVGLVTLLQPAFLRRRSARAYICCLSIVPVHCCKLL